MAALVLRQTVSGLVRRSALFTSVRASSHGAPAGDPQEGKVATDKRDMPDTLGHAVGAERFELLAKQAGNEDPFELNMKSRAKGTYEEPTLIPSMFEKRLVGCVCEEDAISINWMYLHKGESKRCECGYWFKMVPLDTSEYNF